MAENENPIRHDYHLTYPSSWPFTGALGLFVMLFGLTLWVSDDPGLLGIPPFIRPWIFCGGAVLVVCIFAGWWRDVVTESVRYAEFKPVVRLSFRFGMSVYLFFEVLIFAVLFWVYCDLAFWSGTPWPPEGVVPIAPWRLPLLATLVLLLSCSSVVWARKAASENDKRSMELSLAAATALGAIFLFLVIHGLAGAAFSFGFSGATFEPLTDPAHAQLLSVVGSPEAIYGSLFFLIIGLFCVRAAVGTLFLAVCLLRAVKGHFSPERHFGVVAASWYWYAGCVIWLFLYVALYVLSTVCTGSA